MTPVPLGSAWGDRDRSSAEPAVRPAPPRTGRLVAAGTGAALALIGLTVPWAAITSADGAGRRYLAQLTDLRPVAAPVAAVLLILAGAGAAAGFAATGRWASPARWSAVAISVAGAVLAPVLTVHRLAGSAVVGSDRSTDGPDQILAGHVVPSVGCALYVLGLLLLATGAGAGSRGAGASARR